MKKLSSLLVLSLILASCQHKNKVAPATQVDTTVALQNSTPPVSGLSEERSAFKKPAYNTVPDHQYNVSDTIAPEQLSGGFTTYCSSAATTFAATDASTSNNGTYTVQVASVGGTTAAEKKPTYQNTVIQASGNKAASQVVKNATVTFQVKDADSSHERVVALLGPYEAYTVIDKRTQDPTGIQQTMQIRVAPVRFEKLIAEIMKESVYTDVKDISADDVTAQFVDMETRLRSKKDVEKRYTDLLSRAQRINDIIVIENNRRYIREEIEALEGNLRLLQDQVAFSTIYLTLMQKTKAPLKPAEPEQAEASFGSKVKTALFTGWRGIQLFVLFFINIWPVVVVGLPLCIWLGRKYGHQIALAPSAGEKE